VGSNTDAFVAKFNQSGTCIWSNSYGGASAERVHSLTTTLAGDVFVAGSFASPSVDFGGGARTNAGAQGTYDAFVLRLTSGGAHSYSTTFGSTGADHAFDIAIDGSLNAYVAGQFQHTVAGMTADGTDPDGYAMRVGPTGTIGFAVPVGGDEADAALSVGVDSGGAVFGGRFRDSVDFGSGTPVVATGNTSAWVVAYTSAGVYRWQKTYLGSTGATHATAVSGGSSGVVVGGHFQGTVDFGDAIPVAPTGTRSLYIVKYDAAGAMLFKQIFHPTTTATLLGAVQANNTLGITGNFQGSINFGGGALTGGGNDDMFFARFAF
jgi:hypothetical protein